MRNAFAEEITSIASQNEKVVLLSGDIGNRLFDKFKVSCNNRFFNCGVAEANMMGVAAGMALTGFRPVVYTITPFTTTRCFEQVRVDVCYHHAPVIIVGTGSGLSYADLGPTHHSLEDLAIFRTLPGMKIVAPCDATELKALLKAALKQKDPLYMRIGKKGEPSIYKETPEIEIGKANILKRGSRVALLSTGTIMEEVIKASNLLEEEGVSTEIASFHTIKPLDTAYLEAAAGRFDLIVSVEEHGVIGGLGSAIAEWRSQNNISCRLVSFGTPDEFMHEVGSQNYARKKYGLTGDNIAATILKKLKI